MVEEEPLACVYLCGVWWLLVGLGGGCLLAQAEIPYTALHRRVFPLVRDTSHREWLAQLRQAMEENRKVEWNERFFREIINLYLNQSDSLPTLLGTVQRYLKIDSGIVAQLFAPVTDRSADASALITAYQQLRLAYKSDTTQGGYLIRQGSALASQAVEVWLTVPESPPLAPLTSAALRGYLKALNAAYAFFGFDESPESWREKMRVIEAIGLLEYYAYGESANAFRAWKRGYKP